MTRVAHLVINLNHGGAEQLVVRWVLERLTTAGSDSTYVITLDEPGALAGLIPDGRHLCLGADRGKIPWDRSAVSRLRRFLKEKQIDVVHTHNLAAQQYGVLGACGNGVAHVQTQHGANTHLHGLANRLRSRVLSQFTGSMVAVSEGTRQSMASMQFLPLNSIQLIPNGVPANQPIDADVVKQMRVDWNLEGRFVFGSIGRLAEVKAWDRFLPTFAQLLQSPVAAALERKPCLLLVGDGSERAAIEEQAVELGGSESIIFAGFQTNPAVWLSLMDVFLLPSYSEGLSVALLEALESGLYSMVTDVGDCGEVVRQVGHGEIFSKDLSNWVDQLVSVYERAPRRRPAVLSESTDGRIYSQSYCLQMYEDLYSSLAVTRQTKPKH